MNQDLVIVLPAMDEQATRRCLDSLSPHVREMVLLVNNSGKPMNVATNNTRYDPVPHNYGVARSWNLGIEYARELEAEFLFVMSTSMVFGEAAGMDLLDFVGRIITADGNVPAVARAQGIDTFFGWHLHGFRTSVFDIVGTFDEHFWPAYFEDTDMLYRMGLAGLNSPRENGRGWPVIDIDATLIRDADTLQSGLVNIEFGRLEDYYVRKWGGKQGEETFTTPFGLGGHFKTPTENGYTGTPIDWKWWP